MILKIDFAGLEPNAILAQLITCFVFKINNIRGCSSVGGGLDLIIDGARLAAVGMGTVFLFLTALVWATTLMSTLARRYAPDPIEPAKPSAELAPDRAKLIAIISAAIHAHRATQTHHE